MKKLFFSHVHLRKSGDGPARAFYVFMALFVLFAAVFGSSEGAVAAASESIEYLTHVTDEAGNVQFDKISRRTTHIFSAVIRLMSPEAEQYISRRR